MAATTPGSKEQNILVRALRPLFDTRVLGVIAQIVAVVVVIMFF